MQDFVLRLSELETMNLKLHNWILTFWVQIRDMYLYLFRHAIIVNGYVDDRTWRGIRHRNWGDDLNYYFLRELTGRPIVMYHNFKLAKWLHLKNYFCIGTVLDNYTDNSRCNNSSIVWGTGCVGVLWQLDNPRCIIAVRGPYTSNYLRRYGVSSPDVYGDPALLLPLVYQPKGGLKVKGAKFKVFSSLSPSIKKGNKDETLNQGKETKRYRLGIIPHVVDLHHPVIEEIRDKYADEVLIIDLAHYKKWTDVIDQICSCERVLSSSLHGLIVSDAYQVPNCWIELSGKMPGGYFKYFDYLSSVHRAPRKSILIVRYTDILLLKDTDFSFADAKEIEGIQKVLIQCCPFKCFFSYDC